SFQITFYYLEVKIADRDEPYTLHTTLKYRIVAQNPPITPAFSLHGDTGVISVLLPQLDRELVPSYTLLVEVRDMAGQPFGLCTTGTVVIKIEDTNDNAPSFKQLQYETRVEENRVSVEILRVSVVDLDEPGSPGSGAVYEIIRGNDDQAFEITTDKNTNEGILCVVKGLDYETAKQRILVIGVNNEAPYVLAPHSQQLSQSTCSVTVHVLDVDEGPVFKPCLLRLDVKECEDIGTAIGRYVAEDPETGNSEGIRYETTLFTRFFGVQHGWDTGRGITVRVLDRDIGEMRRGQCNVTVLAIDRSDSKLTLHLVLSFFFFTDDCWYLSPKSDIPYGIYEIPISVTDNGGKIGENIVRVNLCDCLTPTECDGRSRQLTGGNVTLGLWAILAMILGSLLLLLILITICGCCGAGVMHRQVTDDCANHNLIISNTEAPGEEVMDHNIIPLQNTCDQGGYGVKTGEQQTFEMVKGRGHTLESVKGGGHQTLGSLKEGGGQPMMDTCRYSYSEWHNFTHPRLGEKVHLCRQDEEQKHSEDYLLSYNYEGKGSLAGSVGCCSDQHEEEALDFLDQLEPKFRTLAETCIKR
uniref:Cadherin domain-containing protein n=1 Tax=Zosterops lateralis melanops TaxID=1220523 RepID=A0A8D2PBM5_ZOSLA